MTAHRFVSLLLLAVVIPLATFAILGGRAAEDRWAGSTFRILFLISVAHGGLSGLFWLDHRYRAHISGQPRRYYVDAALLLVAGLAGAFLLGEWFCGAFGVVNVIWTICHFSRQNWGVLCLTAVGMGAPRPARLEGLACHISAIGGAIGVLPPFVTVAGLPGVRIVGFGLVLCGLALSLIVAARLAAGNAHPSRVAMTVAIGVFFLPAYILGPLVGFVAIGCMHAAQYGIVMTALAVDAKQGSRLFRTCGMVLFATLYLGLYLVLSGPTIGPAWRQPAEVVLYAVVMWHFMIDAGLWRISQPFQRAAVKESFPFLFGHA